MIRGYMGLSRAFLLRLLRCVRSPEKTWTLAAAVRPGASEGSRGARAGAQGSAGSWVPLEREEGSLLSPCSSLVERCAEVLLWPSGAVIGAKSLKEMKMKACGCPGKLLPLEHVQPNVTFCVFVYV